MSSPEQDALSRIHAKRRSFQTLSQEEFMLLLADCVTDRELFAGPNWNWRYGGVRYAPCEIPTEDPPRILVLQWPGSLGDVCMSAPFLSILRQKYPSSQIDLLSGGGAEVFAGNPDLDDLIHNPLETHVGALLSGRPVHFQTLLRDVRSLVGQLKENPYDLLINLQVLPMSATIAKLAGAKKIIGMTLTDDGIPVICGNVWAPYLFGVSANLMRRFNPLHRAEIFCLMIDEEGRFRPEPFPGISKKAAHRVQLYLDTVGVQDADFLIGMHPMAGTPIRQWPYFDQLARALRKRFRAKIIMFGSPAEDSKVSQIVERSGRDVIKATHFTLQELMAALCGCSLLISNDSGPMHLACLLRRKVIALFGPTSFVEVGPWGTEFHVLQSARCRNCFRQTCVRREFYCMAQIHTDDVVRLVEHMQTKAPLPKDSHILHHSSNSVFRRNRELMLGRVLLDVIGKGKGNRRAKGEMFSSADMQGLARECSRARGLIEHALRVSLGEEDRNTREPIRVHDLAGTDSILKPLVVLNDLRFLEKRIPMENDPSASRAFYSGLLKDVTSVMGVLEQMGCTTPHPVHADSLASHES